MNLGHEEAMKLNFKFAHNNINVFDLESSIEFYKKALGLTELRRKESIDNSFTLVFLSDNSSAHHLELTWLSGRTDPYNLGDNEIHLAFKTDNFDQAHKLHTEMDCICYENKAMGIYFISDPDGYWLEIIPADM